MTKLKVTKEIVMPLLSLGITVATLVVDQFKEDRQTEKIAEKVAEKIKKGGTEKKKITN